MVATLRMVTVTGFVIVQTRQNASVTERGFVAVETCRDATIRGFGLLAGT
jgi:hypothetical protein